MPARNGPDSFGWVSRVLHWLMAIGLLAALVLGLRIAEMEISLSNYRLFGLHKSLGIALLAAVLMRLAWHRYSSPPDPISDGVPGWQMALARSVHRAFYVVLIAIPLCGWAASDALGPRVTVFGVTLPKIAPTSEELSEAIFVLHTVLANLLMVLIAVHLAGALKRAILNRDGSLRRILRG